MLFAIIIMWKALSIHHYQSGYCINYWADVFNRVHGLRLLKKAWNNYLRNPDSYLSTSYTR